MKQRLLKCGLVLGCALPVLCTSALAAEVKIPSRKASGLQGLEQKADEYERYRSQYFELQKTVDEMMALFPENIGENVPQPKEGVGLLSGLLKKAEMADTMAATLRDMRAEQQRLQKDSEFFKKEIERLRKESESATSLAEGRKGELEKVTKTVADLRETIDRLLLGEYEYYEVKEGDTLQGIAANPMIYGDPERARWLQQANEGRVVDLDDLREGAVLIVPRFPRNGSYEF